MAALIQTSWRFASRQLSRRYSHATTSAYLRSVGQGTSEPIKKLDAAVQGCPTEDIQAWLAQANPDVRLKLAQGLFANFTPQQRTNIASVFDDIDINSDGYLSKAEFGQWYASQNTKGSTEPPTRQQLLYVGIAHMVPMIGFGFCDNFIMIIAGDAIDASLGGTFHLSTMAAAGLGNLVSDVAGLGLSNTIESFSHKLGIPDAKLSEDQKKQRTTRKTASFFSLLGITIGCLLGLVPLLFIDSTKKEARILFDEIDEDDKGYITLKDVSKAMHKLDIDLPDEQLAVLLKRVDTQVPGRYDFEEFWSLMKKLKKDGRWIL